MSIHIFSHLLQPWILPPGINLWIILLGLLLSFFLQKTGRIIALIGFISLWLLCTPIVAYRLLDTLQNQYPLLTLPLQNSSKDVIVVLGGGDAIQKEYGYKHTVSDFTLHRVNYGAYLHQKSQMPIMVSGGASGGSTRSEADLMADVLVENFNIKNILKEEKSSNTADEGIYVADIVKQKQFKHVYLVTDAWHMPRSMHIFQCRGIPVIAAPMGHILYGPGYSYLSFFPTIQSLAASSIVFHEYFGLLWYRLHNGKSCV